MRRAHATRPAAAAPRPFRRLLIAGLIVAGGACSLLLSSTLPAFAEDGTGSDRVVLGGNPTTAPGYTLPVLEGDPSFWRVTDIPTIQVQQINRTTQRLPGYPPVSTNTQVLAITVQLQNNTPYDLPYSVSFFRVFAGWTPVLGQDLTDDPQHLAGGLLNPGATVTGVVSFAVPKGVSVQTAFYTFAGIRRMIPLVATPQ